MGQIMRRDDWPERLHDYLALEHRFDWLTNNCALFAAGAVLAMTGEDVAKEFRGIKTRLSMERKLRRIGGLTALCTACFGESIPILTARRGDIVIARVFVSPPTNVMIGPDDEDGSLMDAVGVCLGAQVALLTETGITYYPLATVKAAWRVS